MSGLFDIFSNWGMQNPNERKKSLEEIARDSQYGTGLQNRTEQKSSSPLDPRNYGYKGLMKGRLDANQGVTASQIQAKNTMPFHPSQGGTNQSLAGDQHLSWLAKLTGTNMDKAMAHWKDKGGFEGLMSNPAFTMGLAFMQAGAEGKTLGQGALDNVMKAAGISSHYKKIIEDRKLEPIQATGSDIAEVKDMLKSINIEEGNWFENLLGGKKSGARYEAAVEEIAIQFQAEIRKKQKQLKADGKSQVIRRTDQLKILENLVKSGKIQKKESWLSRLGITSGTLQDTSGTKGLARGGPVRANKAYVVGEEGPEIMIAKSSGKVLSNDDSQIFAMLLAANPQLQKVSKARAEKIMRARFPEYFE